MTVKIRKIQSRDVQSLADTFTHQDFDYFEGMYLEHLQDIRQTFLAVQEKKDEERHYLGYVSILWESSYTQFWRRNIPEITDLYVIEAHRKQGIAKALIAECEKVVREMGDFKKIGISVTQAPENKYVQTLYETLGYRSDGFGVTEYNNQVHLAKALT